MIGLAVIGALLSNPRVLGSPASDLPPVHHLTVFFEGCGGAGEITGDEFFAVDGDQVLDSDPVGRTVMLSRYTQPEKELQMLIEALHLELPAQPPPRITAKGQLAE